ncbi:MAG: thioredoxin family protein [Bacilli bacterium]|nr:thioredoxin family protein [Bacilli bacterium]
MNEIKEINLNEQTSEKVNINNGIVVFYTKWCPICKMLLFKFEELLDDYPEMHIYKVDTSISDNLPLGVSTKTVPTTLLYIEGKITEKYQGMLSDDDFDEIINAINH